MVLISESFLAKKNPLPLASSRDGGISTTVSCGLLCFDSKPIRRFYITFCA